MFRITAVAIIPAFLFSLLKITLRAADYGFHPDISVEHKINNVPSYYDNAKIAWRFFRPNIARTSESFVFPIDKTDDTYRIFVLGSSATTGTLDCAYSFGRTLQTMLRHQYPKTNFEVVVPAMPATNSHVVRVIAKSCARRHADLFILYVDNNEVVGPRGSG